MCIYFIVILFMIALVYHSDKDKNNYHEKYLMLVLTLWELLFGLRDESVGNDSPAYAAFFEGNIVSSLGYGTIDDPGETIESGFILVSQLLSFISTNYTFFFFVLSAFFLVPMFFFYRRNEYGIWSLVFFIIMSKTFFVLPIMARQTMSIGFVLLSIMCLSKVQLVENFWTIVRDKYLISGIGLFLFSITIHRTSLILFPLLLFLFFARNTKLFSLIIITSVYVLSIIGRDIISEYFDMILSFIGSSADDNINLIEARYSDTLTSRDFSAIRATFWFTTFLLSAYYRDEENYNDYSYKCLLLAYVLYMLMGTSNMGLRISCLFQVIGFSALVPSTIFKNSKAKFFFSILTVVFLLNTFKNFEEWSAVNYDSGLPYYFFWEK